MKKTLAWIPMLLGALVLRAIAGMPLPPGEELAATCAEKVCTSGAAKPSPVLHYTFGRSAKSLRVKDRSGQGNDGMAARRLRRVPGIVKGRWAARFDGTGDYIRVPRSASLEPEELTVAAWVRIDGSRPDFKGGTIVFKRNPGVDWNEGYCLEIFPDRSVRMTVSNPPSPDGQKRLDSGTPLAPDLWHHLAMTFRPGEAVVYVDGKENVRMRFGTAGLGHNPAADLFIGARDHATYPLGTFGAFDLADLCIWPKALDATQIASLCGEFAGRSKVAHPAVNRKPAPPSRTNVPPSICGTPFHPAPHADPGIRNGALLLHYAFNAPKDGTELRDRSGHQANGIAPKPLKWVRGPGNPGGALRFDGVADYIRVPRSPSMEADVVTVAAWVKIDSSRPMTHTGTIVFKRNTSFYQNEDYHLEIRPDRVMQAFCGDGSGGQRKVVSPVPLAPDVWHHLAMTAGDGLIRLFVDGELVAAESWPHALVHNPEADLFIGAVDHARFPIGNHCPMDLADIRIWSAVLGNAEIAALYREKSRFADVAEPGSNHPPRVFPPWQPPTDGNRDLETFAAELDNLLEQGRLDKAASPEFLDALQRLLDRHAWKR